MRSRRTTRRDDAEPSQVPTKVLRTCVSSIDTVEPDCVSPISSQPISPSTIHTVSALQKTRFRCSIAPPARATVSAAVAGRNGDYGQDVSASEKVLSAARHAEELWRDRRISYERVRLRYRAADLVCCAIVQDHLGVDPGVLRFRADVWAVLQERQAARAAPGQPRYIAAQEEVHGVDDPALPNAVIIPDYGASALERDREVAECRGNQ